MIRIRLASVCVIGFSALIASPTLAGSMVKVVEGCHYPDGWNITDFRRDLNGIPNGVGHQCMDTYFDGRLVHREKANPY